MFFVRFTPTFPVLHRSTFVFRECTHPLLLNAIAIGSLYLGPKDAVAKGEALWRLSHTAIATSVRLTITTLWTSILILSQWQSLITHRGPYDPCNGLQLVLAALLGQVYAALSKVSTCARYHLPVTDKSESSSPNNIADIPSPWLLLGQALWHV
jgi:hypothetical protein